VLIGDPCVGKTAIVEGLALRIIKGDVPEGLKNKSVVCRSTWVRSWPMPSSAASVEERSQEIPHIIPSIDELHTMVGAGLAEGAIGEIMYKFPGRTV
jgi:ATP-dependent Clp protease ATP-binding subunit ClpB